MPAPKWEPVQVRFARSIWLRTSSRSLEGAPVENLAAPGIADRSELLPQYASLAATTVAAPGMNNGDPAMTRREAMEQVAVMIVGWHISLAIILWVGVASGAIPLSVCAAVAGLSLAVSRAIMRHARGRE
jgi:hypothetical protein